MHIAIEGMDGVGKSTLAKNLAKKLNFKLVEKPLHFLFDQSGEDNYIRIRNEVNKSKNKKFTAWFYGLGNIYLYEKFKDENIITDRHLLSNYCWSGEVETDYIFDSIFKTTNSPDFTFLIRASDSVIESRLKNRDINDSDLAKVKYVKTAYEKMESLMQRLQMPGMILDTSNFSQEETLSKAMGILVKEGII